MSVLSGAAAVTMADDWLALRAAWSEVPIPERAAALAHFRLPSNLLLTGTREQIIAAYESGEFDPSQDRS